MLVSEAILGMRVPPLPAVPQFAKWRVAIIHYWFVSHGGGERVVEALAELFPQADIFTLVVDDARVPSSLRRRRIYPSFLQNIPGARRFHRYFLFLQPLALEKFDLSGYDLVISSESGPAKGVITSPKTCHVCYCHSPMRYLWDVGPEYRRSMGPFVEPVFSLAAHYMRLWDLASANRVDHFIANSRFVASRIRKYYRRDSSVIHPPVNIPAVEVHDNHQGYYLVVSRLVNYKRIDLAVEACRQTGRELRIVGEGPEYKALKRITGPTVRFLGSLSDTEMQQQVADCRAFLLPGEEDFGIAPVEAQSYGRPVIAFASGGALETVRGIFDCGPFVQNPTGVFFSKQSVDCLVEAMSRLEKMEPIFSAQAIRSHALQFGRERFKEKMAEFLAGAMAQWATSTLATTAS
jgi:glycosyltransferase involved in cell wall biosynthesis